MIASVKSTISRHGLICGDDRVLAGISGGPDSIALLHSLVALRDDIGFELGVCHLNHHIRGKESDADAAFVERLSRRLGLPVFMGNANVPEIRRRTGGSVEQVARDERYKFFVESAAEFHAKKVALGHNADDNIETFLFNLMRGAGIRGLSGIPIRRMEGGIEIVRPLLETHRKAILGYLKKERIEYRVDSTNLDTGYTRNRIRLRLLPYLRKNFNPGIDAVIRNTSRYIRQWGEHLDSELASFRSRHVEENGEELVIEIKEMKKLGPVLRGILLRETLEERFGVLLNEEQLGALKALWEKKGKYRLAIPGGIIAAVEFGRLVFRIAGEKPVETGSCELPTPGEILLPEWNMAAKTAFIGQDKAPKRFDVTGSLADIWRGVVVYGETANLTQYMDAWKVESLTLRARRPGDRFKPLGSGGTRSLKKLLIDEKVPISVRERIPVICRGDEVIYVPGYRISDDVKVTHDTVRVLKLTLTIFPL